MDQLENEIKAFCKKIEFTNGKYNSIDIFKDLTELTAYFINITTGNKYYMNKFKDLLKKYTSYEQEEIYNLIIELILLYLKQNEIVDILGKIFNSLNMHNYKVSQIFTPIHISDFITYPAGVSKNDIKQIGYIPICEPACRSRSYDFIICKKDEIRRL